MCNGSPLGKKFITQQRGKHKEVIRTMSEAGKGDKPRKVDGEKYRSNYDAIFRKKKKEKAKKSEK